MQVNKEFYSCVTFNYQQITRTSALRDRSFNRYAKFIEKLTFLPLETHKCVCVSGGKKCKFFGKFLVCPTKLMIPKIKQKKTWRNEIKNREMFSYIMQSPNFKGSSGWLLL